MNEPIIIEPCIQKSISDCAVAALAMYLGIPYVGVAKHIRDIRKVERGGLTIRQIQNLSRRIGVPLRWKHDVDISEDFGILSLTRRDHVDGFGHVVVLMRGSAFNPGDGHIWVEVDAALKQFGWEVDGILIRRMS